ncbi:MAG: DUF4339 domain-containing protein [Treponema sp.]|jgi:Pyruvate/2-oxoacid:ferredoxin oxidoreductase gamma subunit|nr:DUF4339 domain-containing protein [Treponema sp.]
MGEVNFYSIDRLVEFGMSMAIAQQMVKSMNEIMANMHIPGAMNSLNNVPPHMEQLYYVIIDGKQAGPFSETELARLIIEKKVVKETYIWMPGMKNWQLAENTPSVLRLVALAPPEFKPEK